MKDAGWTAAAILLTAPREAVVLDTYYLLWMCGVTGALHSSSRKYLLLWSFIWFQFGFLAIQIVNALQADMEMFLCFSVYMGQTDSEDRMKDVNVWCLVVCVLSYVCLYMFITENKLRSLSVR